VAGFATSFLFTNRQVPRAGVPRGDDIPEADSPRLDFQHGYQASKVGEWMVEWWSDGLSFHPGSDLQLTFRVSTDNPDEQGKIPPVRGVTLTIHDPRTGEQLFSKNFEKVQGRFVQRSGLLMMDNLGSRIRRLDLIHPGLAWEFAIQVPRFRHPDLQIGEEKTLDLETVVRVGNIPCRKITQIEVHWP
jgi:hypothetical protein